MMQKNAIWHFKKIGASIALFLGLLASLMGPAKATISSLQLNISLPQTALDFSDIDMRDELNRPIRSRKAVNEFINVVSLSLNQILMKNLTPVQKTIQFLLTLKWDVISGWIKKTGQAAQQKFQAWYAHAKKWKPIINTVRVLQADFIASVDQSKNSFIFLISSLLSSTQILR